MSLIAIGMNLLLAGLLVAAMVVGVRLNGRLKALRDSHEGFESAVRELNMAAMRAEQGLADLRAATDEAVDILSDRIEKGRALATKLERLTPAARELAAAQPPVSRAAPAAAMPSRHDESVEDRLGALLSAARAARARPETLVESEQRAPAASPARRPMLNPDDDLFEDAPLTLDRFANDRLRGARR